MNSAVHRTFWHLLFINHCRFPRVSLCFPWRYPRIPPRVAECPSARIQLHPAVSSIGFSPLCMLLASYLLRSTDGCVAEITKRNQKHKYSGCLTQVASGERGPSLCSVLFPRTSFRYLKTSISSALPSKFFVCPNHSFSQDWLLIFPNYCSIKLIL